MKKSLLGKFISLKYRDRKEIISGFLIDFNLDWTLIKYNVVDYVIDGYMLLKTQNILKYKRDDDDKFKEKVLFSKGIKITVKDKYPINNIIETLQLISKIFGAFQIGLKDDTVCFIGRLVQANIKKIIIREIDPKAKWIENEEYKMSSIRTIEFNNDYVNSLIRYNKLIEK